MVKRAVLLAALLVGCGADVRLGDHPRESPAIDGEDAGSNVEPEADAGLITEGADAGVTGARDSGLVSNDAGRADAGRVDGGVRRDAGGPIDGSALDAAIDPLLPATGVYKMEFAPSPDVRCNGTLTGYERDFEEHASSLGVADGDISLARFIDRIELSGEHLQDLVALNVAVLVPNAVPGQPIGSFYAAVDQTGVGPSDTELAFAVLGVDAARATIDTTPGELRFGYSTHDDMGLCVCSWGAFFSR